MKISKSVDHLYLSELAQKICALPPDEAASFLFEGSSLVLLAGYPNIAYQLFTKLLTGELKISEESSLAHPIKSILPSLCYLMGITCPAIFSDQEKSIVELEEHIFEQLRKYEQVANIDRWFHVALPSDDWSEDFLHEITYPKADIEESEKYRVYSFLQNLHRIISVRYLSQGRLQEADRLLRIFEDVVNARKIETKSYVEQEIIVFGIRTYWGPNDSVNLDKYILNWWQASDNLIGALYLVAYLPPLMKRISEGVLQDEIKIYEVQAQEFLKSVNSRSYAPQSVGFVPTVRDWKLFLEKWNERIFENLDEARRENYEYRYPQALIDQQCLKEGATEEEIIELEKKLQTKLPVSYRNFLLASNGFVILDEYCELFGTDKINWFIADAENVDWAEAWDDLYEVSDEKYFQYGVHQDCVWIRGKYMETALQISSTEDGYVYLLNPLIVDDRKEWEAWDFGSKLPGAYRYRSFWDMMQKIYERDVNGFEPTAV